MKVFKCSLLTVLTACFCQVALAEHHEENFEKMKAGALEMISKRTQALQEGKSCIEAATKKEDLKKCHEALKEDRKELRAEMKERREERKKARQENKEDKK